MRSFRGIIIAQNWANQFINCRSAYAFCPGALIFARFPMIHEFHDVHVFDQGVTSQAALFGLRDAELLYLLADELTVYGGQAEHIGG